MANTPFIPANTLGACAAKVLYSCGRFHVTVYGPGRVQLSARAVRSYSEVLTLIRDARVPAAAVEVLR